LRRKYRSQAAIIRDILKVIWEKGKVKPSRLACYANLPYDRLQKYLEILESKGCVRKEVSNGDQWYILTETGFRILKELNRLQKIFESLGLKL